MNARPMLTVTEAATATGKSRRSIGRLLDAGRLDGAEKDEADIWRIPVEALIAAGLTLHAPSPPDAARTVDTSASPPADALDHLRAELADWRRRAEVAEAIAAERAAALDDVRTALDLATRMLPPGPPRTDLAPSPSRRLFARYRRNQP
jgi:hypothetical protein